MSAKLHRNVIIIHHHHHQQQQQHQAVVNGVTRWCKSLSSHHHHHHHQQQQQQHQAVVNGASLSVVSCKAQVSLARRHTHHLHVGKLLLSFIQRQTWYHHAPVTRLTHTHTHTQTQTGCPSLFRLVATCAW